jgi:hypothetical protein
MAKWFVDKTDQHTGDKSQVGGASKTGEKARALAARMKAQQKQGDSNSFGVRKGN